MSSAVRFLVLGYDAPPELSAGELQIRECEDAPSLELALGTRTHEGDVVLLGGRAPNRLRLARRIRALGCRAEIVLLCEPATAPSVRESVADSAPLAPPIRVMPDDASAPAALLRLGEESRARLAGEEEPEEEPLGVILLDDVGRVSRWSPRAAQLLGCPEEEALGRALRELVPPSFASRFDAALDAPGEQILEFERAGAVLELRIAPLGAATTLCLVRDASAMARNSQQRERALRALEAENQQRAQSLRSSNQRLRSEIEERLQTERELLAAREVAQSATQAKAGFLANISHEIRTPMNGVLGMTHLLGETELDGQQREYVDTIRACGAHLLALVDDILDFSRLEEGKVDLDPTSADIRRVLEESVDTVAAAVREKGLELQLLVEDDVAGTLLIDARRLKQIVVNLLGNAVKFTAEGEVVVWVSSRPLDRDRMELHVEVRDSGIGIEARDLERLFEPFTQADASTTRRFGGTGLGLTICKSLAALMGGRIEAWSQLGEGSTFTLILPVSVVSRRSPTGRRERKSSSDLSRGTRALVLDDKPSRREVLRRILERWDVAVVLTSDPEQALEWVGAPAAPFDVVLIDHELENCDALDVARRLGERAAKLPIVVVSHDAKAAEALGPNATVLLKPAHASRLYDVVVRALSPSPAPRESRGAPPKPSASEVGERPLRILIAEDSSVNRRVLELTLDGLGYPHHTSVGDGCEAIEAVSAAEFDLVLMDVQMPDVDGLEATRRIRSAGSTIPIVAITAHSGPEHRDRALAAGMDDHLSKPINRDALAALLARIDADSIAPEAVDAATLRRLVQTARGDEHYVLDLVETFERESAAQLERLAAACRARDVAQVRSIAHTLKGSSSSLGAVRVQTIATELLSEASSLEAIERSLDALGLALPEAWTELRGQLRS